MKEYDYGMKMVLLGEAESSSLFLKRHVISPKEAVKELPLQIQIHHRKTQEGIIFQLQVKLKKDMQIKLLLYILKFV